MSIYKISYQTTDCARCAGTGQFGPLSVQAGKCFTCGGSGKVLTRAGRAARAAYQAVCAQADRPLSEAPIGAYILTPDATTIPRWASLDSVEPDEHNPGMSLVRFTMGGRRRSFVTWTDRITVRVRDEALLERAAMRVAGMSGATVEKLER